LQFFTDSCKFLTEEIVSAQNFSTFKTGFSAPNFAFLDKNFWTGRFFNNFPAAQNLGKVQLPPTTLPFATVPLVCIIWLFLRWRVQQLIGLRLWTCLYHQTRPHPAMPAVVIYVQSPRHGIRRKWEMSCSAKVH